MHGCGCRCLVPHGTDVHVYSHSVTVLQWYIVHMHAAILANRYWVCPGIPRRHGHCLDDPWSRAGQGGA